jgi:hypothetical protein
MHLTNTDPTPSSRTALEFARETLDLSAPRDVLIFDLQNTDVVLREHGAKLGYLRGQCEVLVESGVWNAAELQRLLASAPTDPHRYHGALGRSLLSKF